MILISSFVVVFTSKYFLLILSESSELSSINLTVLSSLHPKLCVALEYRSTAAILTIFDRK